MIWQQLLLPLQHLQTAFMRDKHACSHGLAMTGSACKLALVYLFIHFSQVVKANEPSNSSTSMTLSPQFACAWCMVLGPGAALQ